MSNNNKWGALSMRDRAFLIREAVRNGITDINSIRDTWEHRFDGESNNLSREDFYKQKQQEAIQAARLKQRLRTTHLSPIQAKTEEEKEMDKDVVKGIQDRIKERINSELPSYSAYKRLTFESFLGKAAAELRKRHSNGIADDLDYYTKRLKAAEEEASKCTKEGFGCIYQALDNYGKVETSNYKFMQFPEKYGFKSIPVEKILPGDLVQFTDGNGYPTHMLMAETPYNNTNENYEGEHMRYSGNAGHALRNNARYSAPWNSLRAYTFVGNKTDSLQWKKEYREKYGHQFSGEESIIQRALGLYNPWSPESMVAKTSSPVVEERLFDVNTARRAVIENDKDARKDLEAANALALTGSLVGASIVPSIVAAGMGTGMAVPLLTAKPFTHKLASKAASFIGSLIGGELMNKAAEKQTGKTVGENIFNAAKPALPEKWQENPYINDYVGPIVGEFLNPAYPISSRVIPNLGAKSIRGANMATQEAKNAAKRTAEVIVRMGDEANIPRSIRKQLINKESLSYIFNPKASKSAYNLPFKYSGQNAATHAAPAHPDDIVDVYFGKSDKLTAYSPDTGTPVTIPVVTTSRTDSRLPEGAKRWLEKNGKDEVKLLLLGDLPLSPADIRHITRRVTNNGSSPIYMGETSGAVKGALGESYIDPGGFNRTVRRNGNIIEVNDFDIWKFTAPEYEKKYFGPRMLLEDYSGPTKLHQWKKFMGDALQRRLKNLGLNFIDKQGTPIVTMWHSDFPYPENLTSTPIVDYDAIKAGTDYNPEAFSILKDILKSKK